MLHEFIVDHRDLILTRMSERAREAGTKWTDEKLRHGLPLFLTQLAEALDPSSSPEAKKGFGALTGSEQIVQSGALHGQDLLRSGFSVAEVVHGYGDICQIVTELASEINAAISAEDFHIFNRCLDNAIAGAVTAYGAEREGSLAEQGSERLGSLMHELRNLLQMATLSFEVLKKGQVGIGGSTGALHARSLSSLHALVDRALAEVRLDSGTPAIVPTSMREFMSETAVGANMLADGYGIALTITPLAADVEIAIDRQLLGSAITNLPQNAFKFTRGDGKVSLVSRSTETRAVIEVWDECGGLPPGKAEDLFRPFTQVSSNRSGLGLGLSIALKAVHAISGELSVRNIPGHGCVFTIDLPRSG